MARTDFKNTHIKGKLNVSYICMPNIVPYHVAYYVAGTALTRGFT